MHITKFRKRIKNDPAFFCYEILGVHPWEKQLEVMEALRTNSRVSVRSGHGTGKSFIASCVALWFLYSHYPAKVITTAPTWTQVRQILWNEIRHLHACSLVPLGGKVLEERLKLSDESFAIGISTDEAERFQGYHSANLLVILDEAPGVRPEIWEAAQTLLTGETGKLLAIGNPTNPSGMFYDTFKAASGWENVAISCLDSPNVISKKVIYPKLVTHEWVEDRKRDWKEGSSLWKSRVLGEFPDEDSTLLVPPSWLMGKCAPATKNRKGAVYLGVDVARHGEDSTVFLLRNEREVLVCEERNDWSTMETAGRIMALMKRYKVDMSNVYVDDTGIGAGVTDRLKEQEIDVTPVVCAAKSKGPQRFLNMRSQMFWNLRQALEPTGKALYIPAEMDKLKQELTKITFSFTSTGAIKIEDKKSLRSKLHGSPNYADALALTYAGTKQKKCEGIISIL